MAPLRGHWRKHNSTKTTCKLTQDSGGSFHGPLLSVQGKFSLLRSRRWRYLAGPHSRAWSGGCVAHIDLRVKTRHKLMQSLVWSVNPGLLSGSSHQTHRIKLIEWAV